ncbi:flagellar biosynthesis protein FlhA [Azoarcus sp. KH32C]|uniref:flagellar biosynthesis protein FlhA n=1 Tax=Azoarcus sp. KH32C TaxID=748247 RepID=UPI000238654E|nr:flagellar biosynthesis protein FlhA [Azoarcus sp. KH32C]BAL25800.1 flagellar biosynthesis protein [Azoarcus sp. KH32C]
MATNETLNLRMLLTPTNVRMLGAPIFIIMVLSMMVLPLPAFVLDVFFTFNIAIAVMVMLVSMYTRRPLEFSVFPTVLLVTTLLRLALNVASTRIVLLEGHTGPDAAGKVIEAFGHFLVGGNTAIGIVVFVILVVINFVVVTKGAGRIAEVAARFTLDAMPGKQMAIDADLNAGLIDEAAAKQRRKEVAQESEFYGAMDGASKFVRGDAVAGILILLINIVGGLLVGIVQHDMEAGVAVNTYTLLTIGDGLVAQIPALIISVAAGLVVSRVGDEADVGGLVITQVFSNPRVLMLTAAIIGVLGLIPGMPNLVFILIASALGWLAWRRIGIERQEAEAAARAKPAAAAAQPAAESLEASWNDVAPVDVLGLEVGYRLIPMVDKGQDGELLKRIRGLRKKFAQEVGFLSAPVHIRDNLELKPNAYRIALKGVEIGSGEAYPGQYLAINPGRVSGPLAGRETRDPAFNLPAFWIDASQREQAHALGYTVVDASTVVATHLNNLILTHASELLGRQETQALLDHISKTTPKLVEDLVPALLSVSAVQRVLQNLLDEGVNIRDMRTIIEVLAENAPRVQDPIELTTRVRQALGRAIVQSLFPGNSDVQVMALDPTLERILMQAMTSGGGEGAVIEPSLADGLLRHVAETSQRQEDIGLPPVLLVPPQLRWLLSRFLRRAVPSLKVIANSEVPETRTIRVSAMVGGAGR